MKEVLCDMKGILSKREGDKRPERSAETVQATLKEQRSAAITLGCKPLFSFFSILRMPHWAGDKVTGMLCLPR